MNARKKPHPEAAMRRAFVRRFGPIDPVHVNGWAAFKAGASWQRRQRRPK